MNILKPPDNSVPRSYLRKVQFVTILGLLQSMILFSVGIQSDDITTLCFCIAVPLGFASLAVNVNVFLGIRKQSLENRINTKTYQYISRYLMVGNLISILAGFLAVMGSYLFNRTDHAWFDDMTVVSLIGETLLFVVIFFYPFHLVGFLAGYFLSVLPHQQQRLLTFRRATNADAPLIAKIGADTFRAAYSEKNKPEDMEDYIAASFNLQQIQSEIKDPACTFFLGYEGKRFVAYAMLKEGPSPAGVTGPDPIELARFYVIVEVIGFGYGSALMRACLDEAMKMGFRTLWLGVWEINQRAIDFYQKWGFKKVGMKTFTVGSDVQDDFVMERVI